MFPREYFGNLAVKPSRLVRLRQSRGTDYWVGGDRHLRAGGAARILGKPLSCNGIASALARRRLTTMPSERLARAGIEPYSVLDWDEDDNIGAVEMDSKGNRLDRRQERRPWGFSGTSQRAV
jgi:hypothetical protein